MSKKVADKKSRSRNLKGLSVFEDEIAAPADYGDFMKIDAPVAFRANQTSTDAAPPISQGAPHWEKFIGADGSKPVEPVVESVTQPQVVENEIKLNVEPIHVPVTVLTEAVESKPEAKGITLESALPPTLNGDKRETPQKETSPIIESIEPRTLLKPKKSVDITPMKNLGVYGGDSIDPFHRIGFGSLVGIQRKIILFIYNECFHHGSLESPPVTREYLAQAISVPYLSMKKSILRLEEKGFLTRLGYRRGRGGFSMYKLSKDIYQELTRLREQGTLPALTDPENLRIVSDAKNKNSLENIKPPISPEEHQISGDLLNGWEKVNFDQLAGIGFSKYHLKQISQQAKFSPNEVQDFINFFAFDLNRNNKVKTITGDPISFFMGILRRGVPYVPPKNYISPEDEARVEYLKYLESREKERVEKENQIREFEFKNWKATADLTEILRNAPEYVRGKTGPILDVFLDAHFEKEVWPKISATKVVSEGESEIRRQIQESLAQNA